MTDEQVKSTAATVEIKPVELNSEPQEDSSVLNGSLKGMSKEDGISKAAATLSQGKRSLLIKDIQQALSCLSDACNLYSELVGPFAAPEAHYYYGKALLENARSELSVLPTEAVPKIQEKDEDDDDDDESETEEKEEDEDENGDEDDDESTKMEEDLSTSSPAADSVPAKEIEGPGPSTSEENAEPANTNAVAVPSTTGEGEEEQSNLELAWEVLEIAKVSYQKQLEELSGKLTKAQAQSNEEVPKLEVDAIVDKITELKRRLSDTHLLLGEVAMESELYEQAQAEFETSLTILQETEKEDCSREVAQVYFQLGLAFNFDKKFEQSIESYQKAITRIQKRIEILQTRIEKKETVADSGVVLNNDPKYCEAEEILELKGIVLELEEKVTDTKDAQKESQESKQEEKVEQEIFERNSPVKNPKPPAVNDISHLVKKKKKLDDEDKIEPPAKKQCVKIEADYEKNGVGASAQSTENH